MAHENIFSNIIHSFFRLLFSVDEVCSNSIGEPEKVLIIRQHNQLGDMLAGVSLFRAVKETFPNSTTTLVVSPANFAGVIKNKYVDKLCLFDKKKLLNPIYIKNLWNSLRNNYDVVIVPATVSISFTSNLLSRFSDAKIRIGPKSLNGKKNKSDFFFNYRVDLDWRHHPDSNVADRIMDIVRPFGISTKNFYSEITFDDEDGKNAVSFIKSLSIKKGEMLIGIHPGAGKKQNRWSLNKYIDLINLLNNNIKAKFYFTGSRTDTEELDYMKNHLSIKTGYFLNRKIPEVAALISRSDLFISNDTGIMHVAGTTSTPQISIFGPTNPYNWAPIGKNKFFIRKSDLIDDVNVDEVYTMCIHILLRNKKEMKIA